MAALRVLQFCDIINRHDFIDSIVRFANPSHFHVGACVRSLNCNIAEPGYTKELPFWQIAGPTRLQVPKAVFELAGILRSWKVDILHTHHYDQAIIGCFATRLHPRTRLVVGRHYSDAIYRSSKGIKRKTLLGLEQMVNRLATRIIAPSSAIHEILVGWQGIDGRKVDQIPYGFVPEKYNAPSAEYAHRLRTELGLDGQCVFGNFSRLHEEKGHRFLLEAIAGLRASLPNIRLVLVGEGPERSALERQVREFGLETTVLFLGWRKDVVRIMEMVDAVIQPTLQEAFSQVMIETLWMKKPLVITDVSGATDVITDGQNGLLVKKADSPSLARAMSKLAGNAVLRKRLGDAGRAFVENHLTIQRVIPQYELAYLKAMET